MSVAAASSALDTDPVDANERVRRVRLALLFGNFTIGCGVMVTAGALNDLSDSLTVPISTVGQLIAIAAVVVGFGAPLLAGWVSGFDRRRLLAWSLVWYCVSHLAATAATTFEGLWPWRALAMISAAIFTPQAAAAIGFMSPPEQRGRAITFIFLGWSLASVLGMPMSAWLGAHFGWRTAFGLVAAMALAGAWWVWRVMPNGVRPAALSLSAWKSVFTSPVLMAMVAVTALQSSGMFTLFPYLAAFYKRELLASPEQIGLMFMWYGALGFVGNIVLSRHIDRFGTHRSVFVAMCFMAATQAIWPLAVSMLATIFVVIPGALGSFATNSGQQARLGKAAPVLAPALMALNTSAIYTGQAVGAIGGGWLVDHSGFRWLNWVGFGWLALGLLLSVWVTRRMARHPVV